ncbi:MAG TPA: hypothetical protein VK879_03390 [Candidatus Sulfomarinibacteraceae bacterium]|nr:hypothetical protein [Candidatus Sulfomarinibacteraceae bacterium]
MRQELSFETLLDLAEGRLSEAEAAEVAALAAEDDRAQALLAWLQNFRRVSEQVVLAEPPAALRHSLEDQFRARQEAQEQADPLPA